MLRSLNVTNFALIEQVCIEFSEGLNIMTGETGAGKSILIDALSMILGNRASLDYIRTGTDFFRVEAVFDFPRLNGIQDMLAEQGILLDEDGALIISRRLSRSGKNLILMNGCHVTLAYLRLVGEKLVDMHGQHENQALLRPDSHLNLLDSFDSHIDDLLAKYRDVYRNWSKLCQEMSLTEKQSRERAQRLDMLNWQTREIAAAELKEDEDVELEREIQFLTHAEKIANAASRAYDLLSQENTGHIGVTTSLAEVKNQLEMAVRYDSRLQPQLTAVENALYQIEDVNLELRDYCESTNFDPARLSQLQRRMDVIYKLRKKYGATIADIINYYNQCMTQIETMVNFDEHFAEMSHKRAELEREMTALADELSRIRLQAAPQIAAGICNQLIDLGMPKATILFVVTQKKDFDNNGRNEVTILFSANAGEVPKPLQKVASGGELSRIALAVKTVSTHRDPVGVIIFDEIDAGVGGQTAQMIAEKIAIVAGSKQVLCITHLPQIACMADSHLYIEKITDKNRTNTTVRILSEPERLREITRMISGDLMTKAAVENAADMLKAAKQKKEIWKNKAQA
ncbi:MAG: DNA repair protein RecN [Veillonellales bacterium]